MEIDRPESLESCRLDNASGSSFSVGMNGDFDAALKSHDGTTLIEAGPAPCDSDYCLKSSSEVEAKPFSATSMFAPIK